jgi:hypothetical protein
MHAETLSAWLNDFSDLHVRAKQGTLTAEQRNEYLRAREELAEALLLSQKQNAHPEMEMRRSLRVAQALPVELETGRGRTMAITLDLSSGGFSTLLSDGPGVGTSLGFKLRLGRGLAPVTGRARVVNSVPQNGSVRVGFRFDEVPAEDRERVDFVVVDAVLKQFGR